MFQMQLSRAVHARCSPVQKTWILGPLLVMVRERQWHRGPVCHCHPVLWQGRPRQRGGQPGQRLLMVPMPGIRIASNSTPFATSVRNNPPYRRPIITSEVSRFVPKILNAELRYVIYSFIHKIYFDQKGQIGGKCGLGKVVQGKEWFRRIVSGRTSVVSEPVWQARNSQNT